MPARHESNRYAFHVMRAGACIVRKRDGASVYFQPGDDEARAIENADHCFAHAEAWAGENRQVFDRWCAEYDDAMSAHAAHMRANA
ncbi:MAG: hypothetical protein FD152_3175 [Xanthobacteraceae bacterium]|nr:MAG: hypothetical protein FD152_3175 [Xanthobacteraceae bacterium]